MSRLFFRFNNANLTILTPFLQLFTYKKTKSIHFVSISSICRESAHFISCISKKWFLEGWDLLLLNVISVFGFSLKIVYFCCRQRYMPLPPLINTNIVTDNEPRAQTSAWKFVLFFFNKIARIWGESSGMNRTEKPYYFIWTQREQQCQVISHFSIPRIVWNSKTKKKFREFYSAEDRHYKRVRKCNKATSWRAYCAGWYNKETEEFPYCIFRWKGENTEHF